MGLQGYTNHSLRATTATILYKHNIPEQQIMETTGHRSLEGVRGYKRTTESQIQEASEIIQGMKNKRACTTIINSNEEYAGTSNANQMHFHGDTNFYNCTFN